MVEVKVAASTVVAAMEVKVAAVVHTVSDSDPDEPSNMLIFLAFDLTQ